MKKINYIIVFLLILLQIFLLIPSVKVNKIESIINIIDDETTWNYFYGGRLNDQGFSVILNDNNEYVTVGWTRSYGSGQDDVFVLKTDSQGNLIWNKTYGGNKRDRGYSIQQTIDHGYIIAGYTESYGNGLFDLWLIKIDENGKEKWNKTYGGYDYDFGSNIQLVDNNGFIITGYTSSYGPNNCNFWLIRTDEYGNLIWDKIFGGNLCDSGFYSLYCDNGFISVGYTESYGSGDYDGWILKTNFDGNLIWNITVGGLLKDIIHNIISLKNGDFILCGETESYGFGKEDIWIIYMDKFGKILWNKTYGGFFSDRGYSACQTKDDDLIVTGLTERFFLKNYDIILLKIDSNGLLDWMRSYGGLFDDVAHSIINTNGGYLIAGYSKSSSRGLEDVWLIKTNDDGKLNKNYFGLNFFKIDIFNKSVNEKM